MYSCVFDTLYEIIRIYCLEVSKTDFREKFICTNVLPYKSLNMACLIQILMEKRIEIIKNDCENGYSIKKSIFTDLLFIVHIICIICILFFLFFLYLYRFICHFLGSRTSTFAFVSYIKENLSVRQG